MARVIVTGPAKRDIQAAHDWWKENRSAEQASRWYLGVHEAMKSLRLNPERCSLALEADLLAQGIRQLLFGLGLKPPHRIVFAIEGRVVVVLRDRHAPQDALSPQHIGH